ncbi:lysozyme [Kitasatospora aureofaciens]|uniref:lysozyme n=1 Tax=Kitasatospora aureofaciens TaxID=1894 RepID=UPI001C484536|nr:lysozyme [Kitasatospora aureofaciens]MBV6701277.1 lysozyme [Kitasatospora aureofaciens]
MFSTSRSASPTGTTRPTSTRRLPALGAALAAATALIAGATAPAYAADPVPASTGNDILHPELDFAGSTVAAHEGVEDPTGVRPLDVTQTAGMDVSGWQGNVDWATAAANGANFAYVKATEGTTYRNPYFAQQYNGSYNAGLIRGAYHFALPDRSSGDVQANFLVDHGGGWSADGVTLPPALDIEYNPYGATCYGLGQGDMVNWIHAFSDTVLARTGRYPTIYTTANWWSQCTGNNGDFGATNPLWTAHYGSSPGTLPNGWAYQTIWQYASSGTFPGDQDLFNGAYDRLQALATG